MTRPADQIRPGYVEIRSVSPDPSVPAGGRLLAVAVLVDGTWRCEARGGWRGAARDRVDALVMLHRWVGEMSRPQGQQR